MELINLFLLLAPLSSLVSANDLVYGRLAKPAAASSRDLPLKGISMRSQVDILYARINIDVFHGVFPDELNKRQTCGSGTTCTAACNSCGSSYIWCGTTTGGSCDCSNSSGSCSNSGGGGSSGGGGGSSGGGDEICGSGRTCTSACSSCGSGYKWCGTYTGEACDCSNSSGSCSSGGGGGGGSQETEDICGSGRTCTGACNACGSGVIWCGTETTPGTCDCSDLNGSCSSGGLPGGSDVTTVTSSTRRSTTTSRSTTSTSEFSSSSRPTDSSSGSGSNSDLDDTETETSSSSSSSSSTTRSSSRAPSATAIITSVAGGNGGASGANGKAEVGFGAVLLGVAALVL